MIKKIILKTGSAFSLVAFAMWYGRDFDYEPLIGVVGSVVALICADQYFPKLNKWDERLAQKFLQELPSSSRAIGILENQDFNATFIYEDWEPLGNFYAYWTNPDHEFSNKKLRNKMSQYLSAFLELKKLVGQHTFPRDHNLELQQIHEHAGEAIAEEMNDQASEVFKQYAEFCELLKKYDFEQ